MSLKLFVANDKGGVGKSAVAQLAVLFVEISYGHPAVVAEYDRQPKLRRFFSPERVLSQDFNRISAFPLYSLVIPGY